MLKECKCYKPELYINDKGVLVCNQCNLLKPAIKKPSHLKIVK